MKQSKIKEVLELHKKWLNQECGGVRAELSGAKGIKLFGPMPTSGRIVYFVWHKDKWMCQAGCFWGDLDKLEAKVKAKHNCPTYIALITMMRGVKELEEIV